MNLKNRQHLLIVLAVMVVGLFAGDRLLLTPLTASWKARNARITELKAKVAEGNQVLKVERNLVETWERMRTNALPTETSRSEEKVLQAFDRWSRDSRINVLAINPQWKKDSDHYKSLECRVEASGTLSAISRFLYEVEKDPMPLKIQLLDLASKDNDGQQITLGLQVSALVLTPKQNEVRQ
jgi:Tfp pilus assembly protein PilO